MLFNFYMRHVTVTNKPDNPIFKLMTDVVNLGERFPSVELGHDKGMGYKIILLKILNIIYIYIVDIYIIYFVLLFLCIF